MERFNRSYRGVLIPSRESSVYSTDSIQKPTYSDYPESTTSTSSQPISIKPSYMNAVPARKPVAPKLAPLGSNGISNTVLPAELPSTNSPPSATLPVTKGLLLLAIAALPHPMTVSYLERMLKRGSYATIVMIGNKEHEVELKQAKMNIYALLGKMSLEVGVNLELQKSWSESEISAAVAKASSSGDAVHGVLCTPAYDSDSSLDSDILALDETELQSPWKSSVGFLHGVAKATLPDMRSNVHQQRGVAGQFLVTGPTATTATSSVFQAACDRIVALLASPSLTIAYAEDVLIPEPEPVKLNGKLHLPAKPGPVDSDISDFAPGESPTRLWNMWALQDELGGG